MTLDDGRMTDEGDRRLTPTQREIRDRCGNVPKRIRRSIDQYRVARGMVPLWDDMARRDGGHDGGRR